ncbi:MAG: hypothetical protein ABJI00_14160 [Paracoccaceae bacterium]
MSTVPKKWRVFLAIESAGISFALALVAVYYFGDASPLLEGNNGILKTFPTWFFWVVNPVAVTLFSVVLSFTIQALCELFSDEYEKVDEPKLSVVVSSAYMVIVAVTKRAKERLRREPCFHLALIVWLAYALAMWTTTVERDNELPVVVYFDPATPGRKHTRLKLTDNRLALFYSNCLLVIGLAVKVLAAWIPRRQRVGSTTGPRSSLKGGEPMEGRGSHAHSLLVGSGIGYWVASLLYVLGCSWHGGGCGWNDAPIAVTVISYVVVPVLCVSSIFIVADRNIFGTRLGTFIKPFVDTIQDRRTIAFWITMTVLRDMVDVWIGFCHFLRSPLLYYL